MPNYNSSEFIQKTIKSVLSQTFTNWELIIIDDNSNNKTKEILKKFTRNNHSLTQEDLNIFISGLNLSNEVKNELNKITIYNLQLVYV